MGGGGEMHRTMPAHSSLDELPFAARNLPTALTKAGAPDPKKKIIEFFEFSCDLKAFFRVSSSAREKKDGLAINQQGFRNWRRRYTVKRLTNFLSPAGQKLTKIILVQGEFG